MTGRAVSLVAILLIGPALVSGGALATDNPNNDACSGGDDAGNNWVYAAEIPAEIECGGQVSWGEDWYAIDTGRTFASTNLEVEVCPSDQIDVELDVHFLPAGSSVPTTRAGHEYTFGNQETQPANEGAGIGFQATRESHSDENDEGGCEESSLQTVGLDGRWYVAIERHEPGFLEDYELKVG